MKYTVTFTAFAEYQLADIWLRARNRQAVTQAADYLDTLLRTDADQVVAFVRMVAVPSSNIRSATLLK